MMKTESFNWQRPAKICNGVKDFGLLREKLANADDIDLKRRGFSSIYVSRAVFIVGVIAIITFVVCLVLADKYQKSIDLSHHYASFVFEKSHDERLYYGRNRENGHEKGKDNHDASNADDESNLRRGVYNASGFTRLQNLSNKLPIEEINLLVPVTTVLRSLNVSRNGRQFWSSAGDDLQKTGETKNVSQSTATTITTTGAKKHGIQSLADLLRRTELKKSAVAAPTIGWTGVKNEKDVNEANVAAVGERPYTNANANASLAMVTGSTQTSIHFAQLESYPRPTRNNNLQHLIDYINCQSSNDCASQQYRTVDPAAIVVTESSLAQTSAFVTWQRDSGRENPQKFNDYIHIDSDKSNSNSLDVDAAENPRSSQTVTRPQENDNSPPSSAGDSVQTNGNEEYGNNDSESDGDGDDDDEDTMFSADSQSAPLYYKYSPPYLTIPIHSNRVHSDPFRNFRASSPVEINRLQLHDQTESAVSGMPVTAASAAAAEQPLHQYGHRNQHHRFSNRMYNGVGVDNFETYSLDLDPYLKPPTPPPPTMLSFTPSYTTTIFQTFNDPSASASGLAPSTLRENDLRSEATAVEPIASQMKPISLMVEVFPANEYELPASVFGGGVTNSASAGSSGSGDGTDSRMTAFGGNGGANFNRANIASASSSSMSWKLAPFSQNKMRLLINLFPQAAPGPSGRDRDVSAPAIG